MKLRAMSGAWSPRRKRAVLAATAGILILAFLLGSLPAWQRTQRNARQIVARDARLASLGDWAVAGFWMEAGARRWQRDQGPLYDRRFPGEKRREQLYLDLARVAREVGIEPLTLCEGKQAPTSSAPGATDAAMTDAPAAAAGPAMLEGYLPDPAQLPSTELTSYPLEARFDTDYTRLAQFMGGLATIDRALTVRSLNAVPDQGVIHVALEMQYYAQKTD